MRYRGCAPPGRLLDGAIHEGRPAHPQVIFQAARQSRHMALQRGSYGRKLVTALSGGVFDLLDPVLERYSFDEFGELA